MEEKVQPPSRTDAVGNRKNSALGAIIQDIQLARRDAEHHRQQVKYLELDVARTDAQLKRTVDALTQEQRRNKELIKELESCRGKKDDLCQDGNERVVEDCSEDEKSKKPGQKTVTFSDTTASQVQTKSTNVGSQDLFTYEAHENLARNLALVKQELTRLAKEKGEDVEKILEAAEYKEMIKQLQSNVQDSVDENDKLRERLDRLAAGRGGDDRVGQVVQLKLQIDKLQRKLALSQIMNDALSNRLEELKADFDKGKQLNKRKEGDRTPTVEDFRAFVPINEKKTSPTKGSDETDGQRIELVTNVEQGDDRKRVLEEDLEAVKAQLHQKTLSVKRLKIECRETEKQREIFEDRYNKLMVTLKDIQQMRKQCPNCDSFKQERDRAKQELDAAKEYNEITSSQNRLLLEDLQHEQLTAANQKLRHDFHIEQWKKNCRLMGQQVDILTSDLKRELEAKRKPQYQPNYQRLTSASLQQPSQRSMAANFSQQSCSAQCLAKKSPNRPFDTCFPSDVEADGPGRDMPDSPGDVSDSPGDTHRPSTIDGAESPIAEDTRSPGATDKLECPRCKQEYAQHRETEYLTHIGKCLDYS